MDELAHEVTMVDVDTLEPWPGNPNEGDVGAITESIRVNGWYGVIVVQAVTGRILAGHHRVLAARALGISHVPAHVVDVDDATAERIVLADNRTTRLGRDDMPALLDMLKRVNEEQLVGLSGTGWDGDDLDGLLARLGDPVDPSQVWKQAGMPGYDHGDKSAAYRCTVHFPTEEDADRFFAMLGYPKNRYLWWPQGDGHRGTDATEQWTAQPTT